MIGYLQGTIISSNNTSLILNVNGVGYLIHCPLPILISVTKDEVATFFIHTHVREDNITLFGFKEEDSLFLFKKLTSVSGIGPKSALAMLSVHSPSSLSDVIERSDAEALSHTPGVGKKTAEKIILELKGKLSHLVSMEANDATLEARLALEALGYSPKEIRDSLNGIDTNNKSTSSLIKEALHQLQ